MKKLKEIIEAIFNWSPNHGWEIEGSEEEFRYVSGFLFGCGCTSGIIAIIFYLIL